MAGHSHWANIQHKKAFNDKKKGKVLSKLIKLVYTAVREGGSGKPEDNPRLRLIIDKCRLANMPKDNIKRAIEKAVGGTAGYEPMIFEGYAQDGVAVVVECLTDNPQRTGPEIRYIFDRAGAKMGKQGSVLHMFQRKAVFQVDKSLADEEKLMDIALDAGAEDVVEQDIFFEIYSDPNSYIGVSDALEKAGIKPQFSEVQMIPANRIEVGLEAAQKISRLMDALEENDDVQNVYANFDVSAEAAAKLAAEV
ncbi:MAG: YebC/PmpR family DNA-binding transcriptional regulator [Planctomycetota bacterium]|jgi:YebC/PmpR family DNA-binding regulatory protein|nr:YebC/PmpR family DNA-binding transcriptional regulator [Planctomycetota bacterium]